METTCEELASNENFKTEICRNWSLGFCQWEDKCIFAHGFDELRKKDSVKINYKTRQCKQFHQSGYCIYGNKCQFLHKSQFDITDNSRRRLAVFVGIEKKGENIS